MAELNVIHVINRRGIQSCVLAFVLSCCAANGHDVAMPSDAEPVEACSIINLIASPEKYDGKRIETWGVARMEFEGTAIYFSSESAEHRVRVNGIYLALENSHLSEASRARLDRRWVYVVGVYHRPAADSVDWRGHIDQIIQLYAPEDVEIE